MMRRANEILLGIALAVVFADGLGAQQSTAAKPQAQRTQPLVLTETIPLEGIKGRFDHFGFGGGRIFVSALGSNSVDRKRVYLPGSEGFIYSYQMKDPDHYQLLAKVPTAIGAATAEYWGKQGKGFDRFYLAVPACGLEPAEVRIYVVQD
jgi:hypothetical protein